MLVLAVVQKRHGDKTTLTFCCNVKGPVLRSFFGLVCVICTTHAKYIEGYLSFHFWSFCMGEDIKIMDLELGAVVYGRD